MTVPCMYNFRSLCNKFLTIFRVLFFFHFTPRVKLKKYNLAILVLDDFYLIAAIAAIGEKVSKVREITVSEKIANLF